MKKTVCILLCVLMLAGCFILAGCGGGETLPGSDEFLGLKDGEEFTTDTLINLSAMRPTGNTAQEQWWDETVNAFNAAYEGRIHVEQDSVARGDGTAYEEKIGILSANPGDLPDVLYIDGPYISEYAAGQVIVPLDNYITETYMSDFLDHVVDQGTYGNRSYALSIVDSTVMLFYNKSILSKAGITPPTKLSDAWTWDDVQQKALSLYGKTGAKTRYGLSVAGDKGEWLSYAFAPMWTKGVLSADGKTSQGYFNGAEGIAAGEFLRGLTKPGSAAKKAANPNAQGTDFTGGFAAMALIGTQAITEYNAIESFRDNWGATFYPANNDGSHYAPCGGWTLTITRDCPKENRVAAAEFIKYLTSKESVAAFAEKSVSPPARKSVLDEMEIYQTDPTFMAMKEQLLKSAQLRIKTTKYSAVSKEMQLAINDILTSTTSGFSVETRLNSASSTIDGKLAV